MFGAIRNFMVNGSIESDRAGNYPVERRPLAFLSVILIVSRSEATYLGARHSREIKCYRTQRTSLSLPRSVYLVSSLPFRNTLIIFRFLFLVS